VHLKRIWDLGKNVINQFEKIEKRTLAKAEIIELYKQDMKRKNVSDDEI
jgi:hypothetical protein